MCLPLEFTFGKMDSVWLKYKSVAWSATGCRLVVHTLACICTTYRKLGTRYTGDFTLVLEKHQVQFRWVGSWSVRPRVHHDLARVHLGRCYLLIRSQLHHELF